MIDIQTIDTPDGGQLVVLPRAAYDRLTAMAEDRSDANAASRVLARGDDELIPAEYANRMFAGEHPVRVYRSFRGLSVKALAERVGISPAYLSQIENGSREGKITVYGNIAAALNVTIDDLIRARMDDVESG